MSSLARHSTLLVAAVVFTSILNYAFGVAVSWLLSPAWFGVLGVAQSLLLLSALLVGSGFSWTVARDLAECGVTDRTRIGFRAAWLLNVALGLILGGGLWGGFAVGWIPLGPAYRTIVPLVGLTTVLLAARSTVNGAVRGSYRFGPLAANLVGEALVKASAGLVLIAAGAGAVGVMSGFALGTGLALAHSLWLTRSARLWQGRGWMDRRVLVGTVPLFVGMLGPAVMLNLDILGLRFLTPVGEGDELAGFYQAVVTLARGPVFVAQPLTQVLFSYVAGAKGRARGGAYRAAAYGADAVRAWALLLLPLGLALVLAPRAALYLFFPVQYQTVALALRIAAAGGLALALAALLIGVLQAGGNRRRPALVSALAIGLQVALLLWLVPRWGILGAAASLLAASCATLLALVLTFRASLVSLTERGTRIRPSFYQVLLPLLAEAIPLLLLPDSGRGGALIKLSLAGLSYLVVLIITNLRLVENLGQRLASWLHWLGQRTAEGQKS